MYVCIVFSGNIFIFAPRTNLSDCMAMRTESIEQIIDVHVSVDCVLIGFDGEQLCALLVRQTGNGTTSGNLKLPGSLIYAHEDLDDAAKRVLGELTGLKNINMSQFKAYGSPRRTANPADVMWLERFHRMQSGDRVGRIVTVAYLSLVRIDRTTRQLSTTYEAMWKPVGEVTSLAFDHLDILNDALQFVRHHVDADSALLFDLLPRKFTAAQLRRLFELVYQREFDVKNFHKRIALMPYVLPLEERESGVRHRAARYYKFDRSRYKKFKKSNQ